MRSVSSPKALVAAWFDFLTPPQREVAEALLAAVRHAAPEAAMVIKWGNLVFVVGDMLLLAIAPQKGHVNLQLFNGSQLPAGLAVLDGTGRGSRSLRCRFHQPIDRAQVEALVRASVAVGRRADDRRPLDQACD